MQNFNRQNNLRGFNKNPGRVGEEIYNATHKPLKFRDKKQELEDYYKKNVKDPSKQIREMKKFNGLKRLGG